MKRSRLHSPTKEPFVSGRVVEGLRLAERIGVSVRERESDSWLELSGIKTRTETVWFVCGPGVGASA